MAMQTGVASSKVLILVGAGLTGSIILRNGRLSDVLAELQELMKGVNQAEILPNHYDASLLAAQIRNLAQEVRDLTSSRPVHIFNGDSSSGGLSSYIMPAAAVGAMGYCYMWWKGWSFTDVMFVTKRNMATAVANMSKQLEQVTAALAVTKRHLTQRLEILDGKLDEQKETSKLIMNEVTEVRTDLSQIGFDVESIQKMISGLEGKIGLLESKQEMTNTGIYYLCQVAGGIKDGFNTKFFQEASSKLQINRSSPTFSEVEPLQGLQFLTNSLSPEEVKELKTNDTLQKDASEKTLKNTIPKLTTLHRSYASGISLRKEGIIL
ncbi:uncharacterized protein LOC109840112 [Asparagus officinalis]|uniref:uncharacterized protein LOC109840112 n=1 Tax=Asparagus officinalis TaxID=4686 RepID=UPI00098E4181|nr:uncharacterized protein LOC109840112 [Asparagus officinalis]